MIFGILVLLAVFATFSTTHFFKFSADQPPLHLAAELSVILLFGIFVMAALIVAIHYL